MRLKLDTHVWVGGKTGPVKKKISQRDHVKRSLGFNLEVALGERFCRHRYQSTDSGEGTVDREMLQDARQAKPAISKAGQSRSRKRKVNGTGQE